MCSTTTTPATTRSTPSRPPKPTPAPTARAAATSAPAPAPGLAPGTGRRPGAARPPTPTRGGVRHQPGDLVGPRHPPCGAGRRPGRRAGQRPAALGPAERTDPGRTVLAALTHPPLGRRAVPGHHRCRGAAGGRVALHLLAQRPGHARGGAARAAAAGPGRD